MTELARAFLAFEIPERVKAELKLGRERLRSELPRARWVRSDAQHLTLKFLGETESQRLGKLVGDLAPMIAQISSVSVQLAGAGFFPSEKRPRVAWIGGSADGAGRVADTVDEAAKHHGFEPERRPWALHLTQARLKDPWPAHAVERFLAWGNSLNLERFVASEVVLLSSDLRPTGAVYTALERMPLA